MSQPESIAVAVAVGCVFALGVFWQPRWTHRLMGRFIAAIDRAGRAVSHRGRHHKRAPLLARPFDERHPRPTVETIAARIRKEARDAAWSGSVWLTVTPDFEPFRAYDIGFGGSGAMT